MNDTEPLSHVDMVSGYDKHAEVTTSEPVDHRTSRFGASALDLVGGNIIPALGRNPSGYDNLLDDGDYAYRT